VNGDIVIYPAYGTGSFEESERRKAKKILKKIIQDEIIKEREEKETEKKQRK